MPWNLYSYMYRVEQTNFCQFEKCILKWPVLAIMRTLLQPMQVEMSSQDLTVRQATLYSLDWTLSWKYRRIVPCNSVYLSVLWSGQSKTLVREYNGCCQDCGEPVGRSAGGCGVLVDVAEVVGAVALGYVVAAVLARVRLHLRRAAAEVGVAQLCSEELLVTLGEVFKGDTYPFFSVVPLHIQPLRIKLTP